MLQKMKRIQVIGPKKSSMQSSTCFIMRGRSIWKMPASASRKKRSTSSRWRRKKLRKLLKYRVG